ncbi:MAG: hypothetical protein WAQ08_15305 [Aquabacterium sp.]|uniref:hypothetical protein n=1 Tax=Aquabacterium sp. TaxID=1872578 RepID=UPI003BB15992
MRPREAPSARNRTNPAEILGLLVKRGLDVNHNFRSPRSIGPPNNRALFWATFNGNRPLVEALLAHGADPNFDTETRSGGSSTSKALRRFPSGNGAKRQPPTTGSRTSPAR